MRNKNKKKQRKYTPKKTITHTIQYLHGSAICLRPRSCKDFTIIREKIQSAATVFHILSRRQQPQNPNHQKRFLYPAHIIHNGLQKLGQPKPPFYGLSLRKSPIKNHATFFQVG